MSNLNKLIGLSYRAKKVLIGIDNIQKNLSKNKLILVTNQLSNDSLKKIKDKSEDKTPIIVLEDPLIFDKSLGLKNVKAISIIDEGFKELIINSL